MPQIGSLVSEVLDGRDEAAVAFSRRAHHDVICHVRSEHPVGLVGVGVQHEAGN